MSSAIKSGKSGSRGEPEKTQAAILKAALEEFAHEGVTGARTDEIARRAGVNKALLYYYFKDKEGLYAAALDQVFSGLHERVMAVLERADLPPRERLLLYARTHFDYIASAPVYPRLVQREFMRSAGRALSPAASRSWSAMANLCIAAWKSSSRKASLPAIFATSIPSRP